MDLFQCAIVILFGLAITDLIVGVSNDAVNFLNSSIGSRAAPRWVIMVIASFGMLAGVTFSSGMMEVARKGIFHPQFFTMPELMVVFLAVMLTDVILLDMYNTFGLPTSTTVSIVFELLGAAVAVSLIKLHQAGQSFADVVNYINTGKALTIVLGILLSVAIAFLVGAFVQLITRVIFTFDFERRLKRYGALWGGVALCSIIYFILIKGSKGASFLSPEAIDWIKNNTGLILLCTFAFSAILLQLILMLTRIHILKVIVLAGTFALAMAFAANDLVNFIGVPLAGLSAYTEAAASSDMLNQSMDALQQPVRSSTLYLLIAGIIMVVTLWISRKSRTVSKTELRLGRQDEGFERFEATVLSQTVVRLVGSILNTAGRLVPQPVRRAVNRRLDRGSFRPAPAADGTVPSFDLLRASVNLMVASALISLATSLKLPLSTTYVTFMVSMGSSLSDQAWGRESAVYRVSGVLTVIGGWFVTAMMASTVAAVFALTMFYGQTPAALAIAGLAVFMFLRTRTLHANRVQAEEAIKIFNLRKITDSTQSIDITFKHASIFLREVRKVIDEGFGGLIAMDRQRLKDARNNQRQVQIWSNTMAANIFKVLRLLQWEELESTQRYAQTISSLQEISESVRDIVMRSYMHVANNHAGLLEEQVAEIERIRGILDELLDRTASALEHKEPPEEKVIGDLNRELRLLVNEYDQNQIMRIQANLSKTRLSIMFYSLTWDCLKIAEQTTYLLSVFQKPLGLSSPLMPTTGRPESDTDPDVPE
jgi:phosphate/sulfate permease